MGEEQIRRRRETLLEGIIAQAKKIPGAHYDTIAAFLLAESIMPAEYQFFNFGSYNADVRGFACGVLFASLLEHFPFIIGDVHKPREFYISITNVFRYFRNYWIIMAGTGARVIGDSGYILGCFLGLASEVVRAGLDYKIEDMMGDGD